MNKHAHGRKKRGRCHDVAKRKQMVHGHGRIGNDYEQDVEGKFGTSVWQTVGRVFQVISLPVSGDALLDPVSCAENEDVDYVQGGKEMHTGCVAGHQQLKIKNSIVVSASCTAEI